MSTKRGKCVVVSDVHLGTEESNKAKFADFIENLGDDVKDLVLLGDIFDLWRRDPVGVWLENMDIVHKLLSLEPDINVSFVVGNHDFHLIKFPESYFSKQFGLHSDLRLKYGDTTYHFIHGYQLENKRFDTLDAYEAFADKLCMAGDDLGGAADSIWEKIESLEDKVNETKSWIIGKLDEITRSPEKRDLKELEEYAIALTKGKYKGEFLVYGHTHEPFVKMEKKIANTGSWVKSSATYLEIDAEGITCKNY